MKRRIRAGNVEDAMRRIRKLHPDEVPTKVRRITKDPKNLMFLRVYTVTTKKRKRCRLLIV